MKTNIEIKSISGKVLFTYGNEPATFARALENAVKEGADLRGADLYGADLRGADLYGADLRKADLREANLRGANLEGADLMGADLMGANLYGANLEGANLRGANLYGANLEGTIRGGMHCKWPVGITGGHIHIGCEKRTIEQWNAFFSSKEELSTARNTKEFQQIQAVYEGYKAYYNFLNQVI
jgi:uncharacterized protein YjbI with pentapeptide repeats